MAAGLPDRPAGRGSRGAGVERQLGAGGHMARGAQRHMHEGRHRSRVGLGEECQARLGDLSPRFLK